MTHRVGPKGQVVIPKSLRDELGLAPGDEVEFERVDDGVVVQRALPDRPLRGRFRGLNLSDALLAQRAADRRHEDAR